MFLILAKAKLSTVMQCVNYFGRVIDFDTVMFAILTGFATCLYQSQIRERQLGQDLARLNVDLVGFLS